MWTGEAGIDYLASCTGSQSLEIEEWGSSSSRGGGGGGGVAPLAACVVGGGLEVVGLRREKIEACSTLRRLRVHDGEEKPFNFALYHVALIWSHSARFP